MTANPSLPTLFSPLRVGPAFLKNRIFSTGHMTVMLEDGVPSARMAAYHGARAEGGAGLIIVEAARAHPSGTSGRAAITAYDDACIPGYERIIAACRPHGCKVFGQLTHPGREMGALADGTQPVAYAPSAVPNERFHVMPRAMPVALIAELVEGFEAAAGRLAKAGLDGIEVLASHGYLLGQFLNPRTNIRQDAYGGSPENRLRLVREVLAAVRRGAGDGLAIGLRISGEEKDHDGLEQPEVLAIAEALAADGVLDYLNVTAGTSAGLAGSTHIVPPMHYETAYTAPLAAAIRARVSLPVFVAGRINQPQIAEEVLSSGQADMCGMTRAMIADPQMPLKAQENRLDDIRACIACNQACIGHMLNGQPISCIQHPETGRELTYGTLTKATNPKRVLVIGGGPAGLKAAAIAAARGHNVTLHEATGTLGGQVNLAQILPGRAEFGGATTNLTREAETAGVEICLNSPADLSLIEQSAPDAVICATGAMPYTPDIPGADEAHIVTAWEVLQDKVNIGGRVVIADWKGDWIGLGLAERLARNGCHVRLAVNGTMAGQSIPQYARDAWLGTLHRLGVEIHPYLRLYGADSEDAYFQHVLSGEPVMLDGVDTLVTSLGHQPVTTLPDQLAQWPGELHLIGDCLTPRTVEEAVLEGLKAGTAL
ncbi:FAD-dependent oxidoreductase [Roseovarius indicus]|uniref:NADH oxidase n=1 Tax=Roseovarius indicus TaxID=540747 RepID=A0A0T5P560_9RHOB|nr:FAD-dependent oxidoreductase [Roseovarius indicus]KRS16409.1 oxidoreductase [Roseovarius indicus]QEW28416.1 NADH oxidase [Roseovarius indicus]SFE11161.1 2,4-dienoyl-CoA reductase [Roseovarius indicus]